MDLSECDDSCSKVVQCNEASFELLVPDEKLPETVEPAMANLDNPAPSLLLRIAFKGVRFCPSIYNMRNIPACLNLCQIIDTAVAGVSA